MAIFQALSFAAILVGCGACELTRAPQAESFPSYRRFAPSVPVKILTPGEGRVMQHFFDKSPISPGGRWVALLRLPYEDRRAAPGDAADVILVDLKTGEERKVAESRAWEHQVGACVMWGTCDDELYFNDVRVGEWEPFLVRLNPTTGERREFPGGAFVISPDGTKAAGYNLKTVRRMNFYGYGAAIPPEAMPINDAMPEDDGLFVTDLTTGRRRLVRSIASFFRETLTEADRRELSHGASYGFQVKWSPDGEWLLFVVVQALNDEQPGSGKSKWRRMIFSCRPDGSEPHLALHWNIWAKGGHHLNFHPDSRTVTMNLTGPDGNLCLMKFDVYGSTPTPLCGPVRGSGHPSVSPDGRWLVTDAYLGESVAYPDGTVPIRLVELATGREREIARVNTVTGERFSNGEFRVDPHPAWSRDGRYITLNAFEGGTRRVLLLEWPGDADVEGGESLCLKVGKGNGGPRIEVNGRPVLPRFYYGSPTCLCNISSPTPTVLKIPFAATSDTDRGRASLECYYGVKDLWYSDAMLVDLTAGTTNVVSRGEEHALNYIADDLHFTAGHRYHFVFTHRASRPRTYFYIAVSYADNDGRRVRLPYYYGDTLGETIRLAKREAGVDFVTFSTDSSWGCEGWWNPPEQPADYSKLDRECARLIAINPEIMLVPRLMTDAPVWMLQRHPEIKMAYDTGFELGMSSVASRFYRQEACRQIEKVARHLKEKFPRNFAGLQISGQNSAEWFYMMSQSENLSGYDDATRDAFREWLKGVGDPGWATAEVPTSAARHQRVKDARTLEFARFRQRDMASFLVDLASAAKRGSRGEALVFFFYGYSWEVGGVVAGAGETGHFAFDWLMTHAKGKIDGFSSPLSYTCRNLTGSTGMMTAAESVMRNGYLWMNEIDHRTHREEMWDHMSLFTPYTDPAITREIFLRDSIADILRGYGDWWMDLFGRGWFQYADIWKVRRSLTALDQAMLNRREPFAPEVANIVDEDSMLHDGWDAGREAVLDRVGFATSGANYGQYLLADVLRNPPKSVKLFYLTAADHLDAATRAKLDALKKARPDATFVEGVTPADITAVAIAERARKAGVHLYTAPGKANVCAAEDYVHVQALQDGPLAIDFGRDGEVVDGFTGECIGRGRRLIVDFKCGENRLFRTAQR